MGVISDVVQLTITSAIAKVAQATFALPLIVSHSATWTDGLVREYPSLAAVGVDFATTTPEYRQAAKLFGQSPRPAKCLIAKCPTKPTQRWAFTPTAVNSYTYKVKVNGLEASFTADSSATAAEIVAGLKTAIDALAQAVTTTDNSTYLRVVANVAGAFHSLEVTSGNLEIAQEHNDPGIATDLAAVLLERSDWFGLLTAFNSNAYVQAVAAWALANGKLYVAQTQDSAVMNTPKSGTDDVAEALQAAANDGVILIHSAATDDFADAAAIGRCFPIPPGELTWKFKTLAGVPARAYTATQRSRLKAKNCNFYEETAGVPMLEEGVTSAGSYADFVIYRAYLTARLGERVFGGMAAVNKVPQNDRGITSIVSQIRAQLGTDEDREVLMPGWEVTAPKAADVPQADRDNRNLPNVDFSCVYAGAFHKVQINGTIAQ